MMWMIGDVPGAEYEELRHRQAQRLRDGVPRISPPLRSRQARSSQPLTAAQIENLRRAILNMFR